MERVGQCQKNCCSINFHLFQTRLGIYLTVKGRDESRPYIYTSIKEEDAKMGRLKNSIAKDIASDLASRLKIEKSSDNKFLKLLSKLIAKEMVKQLLKEAEKNPEGVKAIFSNSPDSIKTTKGFMKAEGKLTKIMEKGLTNSLSDEDEVKETQAKYPNLKYMKPKYANVESILKYVESKDDQSGVKLVIMNFND